MPPVFVELGDEMFMFSTFDNWCDTAQHKFKNAGVRSNDVLALDSKGRICQKGFEFMRARDEEAFPVRVYRALCG